MTPEAFRAWRKNLNLKQKDAADLLGLKKRVIQYYEKGSRDGKKVEIPKHVRLACHAISAGVLDFDGENAVSIPVTAASLDTSAASIVEDAAE
ncbi:helix-turn-helix domain-containing protein [Tepidamorphus sp. 3E244]|uniref:helix-turn-helix domain-containing protein n=1 Tax=Tepidamorphus sp. 3E244 TaxID=3385498 RepID=UPI0038FC6D61